MKATTIIQTIILLLFFSTTLNAEDKQFKYLTSDDGLSYNTIFDIEQDQDGFLWIATGEGLNRYDSHNFKSYYSDETSVSIPSNEVRSLLVTGKNDLFIGTNEGLCIYHPEQDNFSPVLYEGKSLGHINDIIETSKGDVMVCTNSYVFRISSRGEILKRLPVEKNMLRIREDSSGNFWTFKRMRLFHFGEDGTILNTFFVSPAKGMPDFIPSPISGIYVDSKNKLWVGTFKHGPLILDTNNNKFTPVPIESPNEKRHPMHFTRNITEDQDGRYWIGTENGIFIYNLNSGTYEHYTHSLDPTIETINDNAIYSIYRSQEDIMWIGTYFGGINFYKPSTTDFKNITPGIGHESLKGKAISQIIKAPDGRLWMATEDAGIAIFNQQDFSFHHILNKPITDKKQISNNIHALTVDKEGNLWSGGFMGGINKINPVTYEVVNYCNIPGNRRSLINNFVFSLYNDADDLLWVGTMNGIDCFDKKTNEFIRFKPEIFNGTFIYDIFQDNEKNFWFLSNNKHGVYCYNKQKDKVINYLADGTPGLRSNSFISHCIDSEGRIWLGSRGGGLILLDPVTKQFEAYTMDDGLPNNVIYGIIEDNNNNLWLSSNKGISKFNYITKEIQNFTIHHGLVGNQFNYKSYFQDDDGKVYFGAVNGLTWFQPEQVKIFESEPRIHFTNFSIFNKPVNPGNESVLENAIDLTDHITLKHNQNVISFDFIALDFHSMGKNNFYHFLEGFEPTWQAMGNKHTATYTNLPPGDYFFHVKATNISNFPNDHARTIKITVLPPVWKTFWAYCIYGFIIIVVSLILYRFLKIRHAEKMSLKIEKIEKEKLQQLHRHKINFFTYISHEFKTPLTIILASVDSFFSSNKFSHEKAVETIKYNANRLEVLINQLMDFREIETDHANINLQNADVIGFLTDVFNAYTILFKKKNIEYNFSSSTDYLNMNFDPDKLEKIISNLLSNAFKYTPEYGKITLETETVEKSGQSYLKLIISDTGKGMTNEQLRKIFKLFYKIEDKENLYQGSGVGLALTKSLVHYIKGSIHVESKKGKGTTFIVHLPYENKVQKEFSGVIRAKNKVVNNLIQESSYYDTHESIPVNSKADFEILFVEDDKDMMYFLIEHFMKKYKVKTAYNGEEALKSIRSGIPDLIVSDMMMPKKDGIALCEELKTNFEYCHIPFIMLTAKSDVETRIKSLEVGADIYLPKPFHLSELSLHIRNMLIAKTNQKQHFFQFGRLDVKYPVKNKDQFFIEKTTTIIIQNLKTPGFGVSMLVEELGIGRTLLHMKLKQIMDLSATDFINTVRLREAQKLLIEEPMMSVGEVAYQTGFNDPSYFSRLFRKLFNISPTDFRILKSEKPETLEIREV